MPSGSMYGEFGESYFRIALTNPAERLGEAMDQHSGDVMVTKQHLPFLQPFFTVIPPKGRSREPYAHQGEEFGIVLGGNLCCQGIKVGDYNLTSAELSRRPPLTPWL